MDSASVVVKGGRNLRAGLRRAAGEVQHGLIAEHRAAGEYLVAASKPDIPRKTGALADAGDVDSTGNTSTLTWDLRYAGVQYYGWADHNIEPHPWADEAAPHAAPVVAGILAGGVQRVLNRVKGI